MEISDGEWSVVVMNADGSRGVDAVAAVGAELDGLTTLGFLSSAAGSSGSAPGTVPQQRPWGDQPA